MFRNYLRIALRYLTLNKSLSFINIAGLALGMAGATLLLLNIQYDASVDQFHEKKDRLYMVYNKGIADGVLQCWNVTAAPLGPALRTEFPEISSMTRTMPAEKLFQYHDKLLKGRGQYVDSTFLSLFTFPLLRGDINTALSDPRSIVLTEQLAKKLFGDEDPMNKTITVGNTLPATVTGIVKDPPYNTDIKFDYLLPWAFGKPKGTEDGNWNYNYTSTYVELSPGAHIETLNKKIAGIAIRHDKENISAEVFLYPFSRVFLYNHFENGKPSGGRIDNLHMLASLAAIILLIACINFMNLGTARSEKRAKEVGVRKVIGANRSSLIFQFIGESVVFAAIAGVLALLLVQALLPVFSGFARAHLAIDWQSPVFWLLAIGFILLTGLLAGSYPAFYLSSFRPAKVLKGIISNGNALVTPRKILVVLQFVLAIFLINFTLLLRRQIQFTKERPIGYTKENLLYHPMTDQLRKNYTALKNELIASGTAEAVAQSSTVITQGGTTVSGLTWPGMDPNANPGFESIAEQGGFVRTNGLQLIAGRDIDVATYPSDTNACVINETAARLMKMAHPVGQVIPFEGVNWKIVGVVKDFLIESPYRLTSPLFMRGTYDANYISIRLGGNNTSVANIERAEAIIKKYNPGFLTECRFADEDYAAKFKEEEDAGRLLDGFALVAVFISCMGLLGLSIYMAENRIREVGIRKVLGAGVGSITLLLTRDFVRLVLIAILLASPLAWLFMRSFLRNFAYRTEISIGLLIASGGAALLIALITVSFHSIKAAVVNPVKSLRTE
jgi:ABC-type antimicrobial peptide transport system permease subunit